MVTKKSKRFIKALQSFCMIDNIVPELFLWQPETMHWRQRRWYESVEDPCSWMQKTI